MGLGFGGSFDLDNGGPADDGQTIGVEAEFGCGPLSAGVGASLDSTGCARLKAPKAGFGNSSYSNEGVGLTVGGEFGALVKTPKCGIQGKISGKICRRV